MKKPIDNRHLLKQFAEFDDSVLIPRFEKKIDIEQKPEDKGKSFVVGEDGKVELKSIESIESVKEVSTLPADKENVIYNVNEKPTAETTVIYDFSAIKLSGSNSTLLSNISGTICELLSKNRIQYNLEQSESEHRVRITPSGRTVFCLIDPTEELANIEDVEYLELFYSDISEISLRIKHYVTTEVIDLRNPLKRVILLLKTKSNIEVYSKDRNLKLKDGFSEIKHAEGVSIGSISHFYKNAANPIFEESYDVYSAKLYGSFTFLKYGYTVSSPIPEKMTKLIDSTLTADELVELFTDGYVTSTNSIFNSRLALFKILSIQKISDTEIHIATVTNGPAFSLIRDDSNKVWRMREGLTLLLFCRDSIRPNIIEDSLVIDNFNIAKKEDVDIRLAEIEDKIHNKDFTTEQLSAINSGITVEKVEKIDNTVTLDSEQEITGKKDFSEITINGRTPVITINGMEASNGDINLEIPADYSGEVSNLQSDVDSLRTEVDEIKGSVISFTKGQIADSDYDLDDYKKSGIWRVTEEVSHLPPNMDSNYGQLLVLNGDDGAYPTQIFSVEGDDNNDIWYRKWTGDEWGAWTKFATINDRVYSASHIPTSQPDSNDGAMWVS